MIILVVIIILKNSIFNKIQNFNRPVNKIHVFKVKIHINKINLSVASIIVFVCARVLAKSLAHTDLQISLRIDVVRSESNFISGFLVFKPNFVIVYITRKKLRISAIFHIPQRFRSHLKNNQIKSFRPK